MFFIGFGLTDSFARSIPKLVNGIYCTFIRSTSRHLNVVWNETLLRYQILSYNYKMTSSLHQFHTGFSDKYL